MTVAPPPPRPPAHPDAPRAPAGPDPAALIEEARQRARRRRRTGVALTLLLGVALVASFLAATGRLGDSSTGSAGPGPVAQATEPGLIAYGTGRGELYVVSADGSGRRLLT